MEVVERAGRGFEPRQVIGEDGFGEVADARVARGRVERVGRVREDGADAFLCGKVPERRRADCG